MTYDTASVLGTVSADGHADWGSRPSRAAGRGLKEIR
jgi:hypothetical protein